MMSNYAKMKRVTDPLDDKVKARIIGRDRIDRYDSNASSGSEHSAHADDGVTPSSLSELFFNFSIDGPGDASSSQKIETEGCESDQDLSIICDESESNVESIKLILVDGRDAFQNLLKTHVLKALQVFSIVQSNKQMLRRNVMAYLRDCGYNAAICKTKWESCGGLTAGNYEFIDVVQTENSSVVRYFVDLDFASEFEIARPTSSYERVLHHIPRVFVGKCEDLKKILKAACEAAKRSLKSGGLLLPPWRKHRFMQNKWVGPYRRTTNLYPVKFCAPSSTNTTMRSYRAVKCRAVGFDVAVNGGGHLSFPATARTR